MNTGFFGTYDCIQTFFKPNSLIIDYGCYVKESEDVNYYFYEFLKWFKGFILDAQTLYNANIVDLDLPILRKQLEDEFYFAKNVSDDFQYIKVKDVSQVFQVDYFASPYFVFDLKKETKNKYIIKQSDLNISSEYKVIITKNCVYGRIMPAFFAFLKANEKKIETVNEIFENFVFFMNKGREAYKDTLFYKSFLNSITTPVLVNLSSKYSVSVADYFKNPNNFYICPIFNNSLLFEFVVYAKNVEGKIKKAVEDIIYLLQSPKANDFETLGTLFGYIKKGSICCIKK